MKTKKFECGQMGKEIDILLDGYQNIKITLEQMLEDSKKQIKLLKLRLD